MILDFEKAMDAWRGTNKGVDEAFRAELERQAQQAVEAERKRIAIALHSIPYPDETALGIDTTGDCHAYWINAIAEIADTAEAP